MNVHFKNFRLIDPYTGKDVYGDLCIEKGKIVEQPTAKADRELDGHGMILAPAFVDAHCHLRDPGQTWKEDIESGTRAAAAGGFAAVMAMPNTDPVCDSAKVVRYMIEKAQRCGSCAVLPVGAVTLGEAGEELAPYEAMKEAGAVALTDDGHVIATAAILEKSLKAAAQADLIVIDHPEERSLSCGACMHEGEISRRLGVKGMPASAEAVIVARDLLVAEDLQLPVHLCHLSCAQSVSLLREARARGVQVTADTCPHYFALTDEAVLAYGANAKMYPPLRPEKDRQAILEALLDGTIDLIATDHAPHAAEEKSGPLAQAKNGIIGLQTAFSLSYEFLCKKRGMSIQNLLSLLSANVSAAFHLNRRGLQPGASADLVILDPEREWIFQQNEILSRSTNSPFIGRKMLGKVVMTLWNGEITYEEKIK